MLNKIIKIDYKKIAYYLVITVVFLLLLWLVAKPYFGSRYDYNIGDISQDDILSSKDITYVNIKETQKRINEVKKRTPAIFDLEILINEDVLTALNHFFDIIEKLNNSDLTLDAKIEVIQSEKYKAINKNTLINIFQNYKDKNYKEKCTSTIVYVLNNGLSNLNREQLLEYKKSGIIVKRIQKAEITQEKIEVSDIIASDEVKEVVTKYLMQKYNDLGKQNVSALTNTILSILVPNVFYNREESHKLMNEQIEKVEPVLNTIKKGAIVIRHGEEINDENYPKLKAISLYASKFNIKAIIGIGILLFMVFYLSIYPFKEGNLKLDLKGYITFLLFTLFVVFYSYLITLLKNRPDYIIFGVLVPTAGITMIAEVLYKRKLSFILAMILPIFLLLISGNDPYTFIFSMGSGLIAIYSVKEAEKRSDLLKPSLFIIGVNILLLVSISLLKEFTYREITNLLIWGAGNGIVSVILALGIIPFFEIIMNIPTNFRLLELSSLNTPIMKKMQNEAPGTYHHSINVANMAENAARLIKANALLVRVAALYHDIGKIPNAEYYIENKKEDNKHNYIKPSLSNSILKAHVKIGVDMAKEMKLPEEVIDIISQHHGTSLMKYFYHQALKSTENGTKVDQQDYHYQGPKPQTREAAIVMLADTVEAASRVLKKPSAKRIEEFVNDNIESKFREKELNESTLTFRGLMKISIAFRRYLTGVFHSRIEYPDENEIEKDINGAKKAR